MYHARRCTFADVFSATLLRLNDNSNNDSTATENAIKSGTGAQPLRSLGRVVQHTESITLQEPGVYVIRYSNTFSYWKEKHVGHFHTLKQ